MYDKQYEIMQQIINKDDEGRDRVCLAQPCPKNNMQYRVYSISCKCETHFLRLFCVALRAIERINLQYTLCVPIFRFDFSLLENSTLHNATLSCTVVK